MDAADVLPADSHDGRDGQGGLPPSTEQAVAVKDLLKGNGTQKYTREKKTNTSKSKKKKNTKKELVPGYTR